MKGDIRAYLSGKSLNMDQGDLMSAMWPMGYLLFPKKKKIM
jgi:hypothetical protein